MWYYDSKGTRRTFNGVETVFDEQRGPFETKDEASCARWKEINELTANGWNKKQHCEVYCSHPYRI